MTLARQRIFFALIACAILAGLGQFALRRFQSGELYPTYSTLRAEPDGSKALYESIRRIQNPLIHRNLERIELLSPGAKTTLVFLGVPSGSLPFADEQLREMVREGARVVVTIDARTSRTERRENERLNTPFPDSSPNPQKADTNIVQRDITSVLGLTAQLIDPLRRETNRLQAGLVIDSQELPESIFWYGRYFLQSRSNEWKTVYAIKNKAVVLTRKIGLGSLIVVADSFPFSNEGLHVERSPEFLLWTLGAGRDIIFDETHLGVERGTGVTVLMREYRLHGLVAGCLLLVALWIWRNSTPLVPAPSPANASADAQVEGKAAREGIVHLLRRNISEEDLLRVGLEEWAKANRSTDPVHAQRLKEARQIAESFASARKSRSLAGAQHEISQILFPKRT